MEQWVSLVQSECNHLWTVSHRETCRALCGVRLISGFLQCCLILSWAPAARWEAGATAPDRFSTHATHVQNMPVWRKFRGKLFCLHPCKKHTQKPVGVHCIFIPYSPCPAWSHLSLAMWWCPWDRACIRTGHPCCPVLSFSAGEKPKESVYTPKKSDSNWKRAQKLKPAISVGKDEREKLWQAVLSPISWQETSACTSQITSQRKKAQSGLNVEEEKAWG